LQSRSGGAGCLASLVLLQVSFANPNGFRRYLDQLVVVDKLKRVFQRRWDRRRQYDVFVGPGGALSSINQKQKRPVTAMSALGHKRTYSVQR